MLRLAMATSVAEVHLACADLCTGFYDVDRHMYLRRSFTAVYVAQGSRSVDTHKHYIEGAGYTEHIEFIDKLQTPEELEPIARGPQNTGKRPKHAKAKPKACLETLNLLRTPSNRGVAYPMDNVVDIARADPEPPVADGNLRAEAATDSLPVKSEGVAPVEYSGINCMARVWGGGQGGQCSRKRKDGGDYCRTHSEDQFRAHGRIDGEIPKGKRDQMKCAAPAKGSRSSPETALPITSASQAQEPVRKRTLPEEVPQSRQGRAISAWRRCNLKAARDVVLKFAMQTTQRSLEDRQFEKDMITATRKSLTVDPKMVEHMARKKALMVARLELLGMERRDTPAHGDCQYIALVRALGWPDSAQGALRQEVAAYLAQNAEDFEGFNDISWGNYIRGVRGSDWGDHLTLVAVSRMFNCVINVVSDTDSEMYANAIIPPDIKNPTITIAHYAEKHYESCEPSGQSEV